MRSKACLLLIVLLLSQDLPENHRDRVQQLEEVTEAHWATWMVVSASFHSASLCVDIVDQGCEWPLPLITNFPQAFSGITSYSLHAQSEVQNQLLWIFMNTQRIFKQTSFSHRQLDTFGNGSSAWFSAGSSHQLFFWKSTAKMNFLPSPEKLLYASNFLEVVLMTLAASWRVDKEILAIKV